MCRAARWSTFLVLWLLVSSFLCKVLAADEVEAVVETGEKAADAGGEQNTNENGGDQDTNENAAENASDNKRAKRSYFSYGSNYPPALGPGFSNYAGAPHPTPRPLTPVFYWYRPESDRKGYSIIGTRPPKPIKPPVDTVPSYQYDNYNYLKLPPAPEQTYPPPPPGGVHVPPYIHVQSPTPAPTQAPTAADTRTPPPCGICEWRCRKNHGFTPTVDLGCWLVLGISTIGALCVLGFLLLVYWRRALGGTHYLVTEDNYKRDDADGYEASSSRAAMAHSGVQIRRIQVV